MLVCIVHVHLLIDLSLRPRQTDNMRNHLIRMCVYVVLVVCKHDLCLFLRSRREGAFAETEYKQVCVESIFAHVQV
jgi:hypothetical protein